MKKVLRQKKVFKDFLSVQPCWMRSEREFLANYLAIDSIKNLMCNLNNSNDIFNAKKKRFQYILDFLSRKKPKNNGTGFHSLTNSRHDRMELIAKRRTSVDICEKQSSKRACVMVSREKCEKLKV